MVLTLNGIKHDTLAYLLVWAVQQKYNKTNYKTGLGLHSALKEGSGLASLRAQSHMSFIMCRSQVNTSGDFRWRLSVV